MSSANDHDTTREPRVHSQLASIRHQRGIAAAELARKVGVSRQTVYAMEAGSYVPNTSVALRLARILEVPVEELFHLDPDRPAPPPTIKAHLVPSGDLFPGSPIELCPVDGRMVGVPALPAPWQLLPADGLLVDAAHSTVQLLHDSAHETRLLIAGCDPATSVLARHLQRAGVGLVSASVNSSVALKLLQQRMVHVAGTHLHDDDGGKRKAPIAKMGAAVYAFAVWEEGLVLARGNPKRVDGIQDLARKDVTLANRESGSGSRQLLDRSLKSAGIPPARVRGYKEEAAGGHLAAAWHVYTGLADCCVATRSAARAFGLDFQPLASERYDLVIRREHLQLAAVERLLDTLSQAAFRRELEGRCAYDTKETGRRIE
jgi:molybdopterin molybdotransferase/putative molybdopterin biosynthesis protein